MGAALDKVVALANVRGYSRVQNNHQVMVHPYSNMRAPAQQQAAQASSAVARANLAHMPHVLTTWNKLSPGQTVLFGNQPWKVLKTYIYNYSGRANTTGTRTGATTGSAGAGINTKGGATTSSGVSTGSAGTGINTAKTGTSMVTNLLRNMGTGKELEITLPPTYKVTVL